MLEDLSKLDLAKARQFFRIIEWQADRMRGLIWDLLEVARIEAGTLFLAPEPTDLAALVGQARAAFLEGGAGNPVEVDLPSGLPRVAADRQRVLQVLDHLLSNASNYSQEGSLITVSAWREDLHVAVCVADRGRGIPGPAVAPCCSAGSPGGRRGTADGDSREMPWVWRCAGASWRPTGDASGPRAMGPAWGTGSSSPYRRRTRPRPAGPQTRTAGPPAGRGGCWWWMTTRRHSGI